MPNGIDLSPLKRNRFNVTTVLTVFIIASAAVYFNQVVGINLVLLIIALTATVLIATLKFEYVMTVLVLVTMFTGFQLPVAGINLRLDTMLVPAAALCALFNGYGPQVARWCKEPAIQLLMAFVVLNAASSIFASPDPGASLRIVIWYASNLVVLILALACWGDRREKLLNLLFIGGVVNIVTGLAGWIIVSAGGTLWGQVDLESGVRARGIAYEPNILAGICAIWVFLLITQQDRVGLKRWLLVAGGFMAIALTSTRASLVAVIVAVVLYFVFRGKSAGRLIPLGIFAVFGAFIAYLINPDTYTQMTAKLGNLSFNNDTANYRFNAWEIALNDMQGWARLFGLGTNSYGRRHLDPTDPTHQSAAYIGNLPLQTYYDVGIIGVGLLAAVVFIVYRRGSRTTRHLRFAGLVMFLIISTACSPFFFAYFWLLIGVGLASKSAPSEVTLDEKVHPESSPEAPAASGQLATTTRS
jgi:hypothetical protein